MFVQLILKIMIINNVNSHKTFFKLTLKVKIFNVKFQNDTQNSRIFIYLFTDIMKL